MGHHDVSSKDTVWLRETWKHDNRAVSHSASCARAERHEARKARDEVVHVHVSTWSSAMPDGAVSGAWSDDEAGGPSEAALGDREKVLGKDVGEDSEESVIGKMIVLLKPFCNMPPGTKAIIIEAKPTRSGARQRFILGPTWAGQCLGQYNNEGILSDKLGKLYEFCEAEAEEEELETPPVGSARHRCSLATWRWEHEIHEFPKAGWPAQDDWR